MCHDLHNLRTLHTKARAPAHRVFSENSHQRPRTVDQLAPFRGHSGTLSKRCLLKNSGKEFPRSPKFGKSRP